MVERIDMKDVQTLEKKLKAIEDLLANPEDLCDGCEAMAYYGALYPICKEMLEKFRKIMNAPNVLA